MVGEGKGFFLKPGVLSRAEAPTRVAAGKAVVLGTIADLRRRLSRSSAPEAVVTWFNAALGSATFSIELDRWMRQAFSAKATIYDKFMDAEYIRTHVGGGYHRLFDGGHDCLGAWDQCREAAGAAGDSFTAEVLGYAGGLWKDLVTPMGLPVMTFDKADFDQVAGALQDTLGITRAWVADAASFTSTELL
ncbi:MAG TPA: hypothetical protein VLL76_01875, partial [Candidatus Omnitrophota bacterium]|nr:hypothetical protein [Candidatus Omnitrophota bacterium]